MTSFSVTLPVPPSANALFANGPRGKGRIKTKAYKDWLEEAGWHLKTQWAAAGKPTFPDKTPMSISMCAGIGRKRDLSNCCKAVEDLIVATLPVPDDRWNDFITMTRWPDATGMIVVDIRSHEELR